MLRRRENSREVAISYARKRLLYRRASAFTMPDNDGALTLANAICVLAAGAHSKNVAEQEQIAAAFHHQCLTDFKGVRVSPAFEAFVADFIKRAKK